MKRRGFNELKKQILKLLLRKKENATSQELTSELGTQKTNTCDCLLRLKKQHLVDRNPINVGRRGRPRYMYSISSRGRKRLKYWISNSKKIP